MILTAIQGALTAIDSSALVATGSLFVDKDGNEYVYLKGVASTVAGNCMLRDHDDTDHITARLTETEGAKGRSLAVALAAVVADKYGWFQIAGKCEISLLASDAADAVQYCTTTAGSLDDAGTTKIHGLILIDTVTGAGLGTCIIDHPHTAV